ncbi:MAG: NADH-quinone oxidoreductase subunit J [Actinobacteria bacterium]|nr:NADH-quinone oxidoreductase subunit J [Actinomycetota bacterium]
MWEQQVAFWIIAVAMAGAAIGVVRANNVVHAALFLIVVFAGSAAQYILLLAEFVAWVQVLIYIGAIIVLFLFGVMLTRAPMREERGKLDNSQRLAAAVVALFLFGVLAVFLVDAFAGTELRFRDSMVEVGSAASVGESIFRQFVIPFEVVSMLLLAALVGAVALARRD